MTLTTPLTVLQGQDSLQTIETTAGGEVRRWGNTLSSGQINMG